MIRKLLCWLGFHEWIKLPRDYKVELDWECWKTIDFDNYDEDNLFKCKHCGKVKVGGKCR